MTADHFTLHKNGHIEPCCGIMKNLTEDGCISILFTLPDDSNEPIPHPGLRFFRSETKDLVEALEEFNDNTETCSSDEYYQELRDNLEKHFKILLFQTCPFCHAKMIREEQEASQ